MMRIIKNKNTRVFSWIMLFVVVGGLAAMKSFSVVYLHKQRQESEYSVKTFQTEEIKWGYYVLKSGKTIIKQDVIPAIPKNVSFLSKDDAEKTSHLVLSKLKNGNNPTISIPELEQMKIKF